jgi:hypothetical protein
VPAIAPSLMEPGLDVAGGHERLRVVARHGDTATPREFAPTNFGEPFS